jgi:hypothetical protein
MLLEIKLKYYNSDLHVGFNTWREIYDCNKKLWVKSEYHLGRVVYGKERLPYKKIVAGVDVNNFTVQEFCPF